jgi:hypothetical protein
MSGLGVKAAVNRVGAEIKNFAPKLAPCDQWAFLVHKFGA